MLWQFSIYTLPPLITVCCSVLLCAIAWWYREYRIGTTLVVLLIAVSWWSLAYFVGLSATGLWVKRLAHALVYPGVGALSIAWFVFAVQYTGRLRLPTRSELAALAVLPVITGLAPFTERLSGLVWPSVSAVAWNGLELMTNTHGILFWLNTVQAYVLIGLGTVLILSVAVLNEDVFRSQAVALTFAAVFPLVMNLGYFLGLTGPLDFTPAGFSLSGAILLGAVFRNQLLRSLPLARELAREELFEQMSSAVIIVDNQDRIVDLNPAAAPLARTIEADARGSPLETVFPSIGEALASDDGSVEPIEFKKPIDGVEKYYQIDIAPLERGHGTVQGEILTIHDVTAQRQNRQELEQERQFVEQAINTLNDVFYVIEPDGELRRWNNSLETTTGYDAEEIAEMHTVEFFAEESRDRLFNAIQETLETGEITVNAEFQTADGKQIPHEFTGNRLTDPDGELVGLVGVGRDISERKARERELRAFQEAVEVTGRMIYWMNRDGTVEYANHALTAQIGSDSATISDEEATPLTARADQDGLAEEMLATLREGESWKREFVTQLPDRRKLRVDQSVTPVYEGDEISRFVAIAADVTSIWRRNQQLSVLQRVLRHDLRNNLNEILLSIQMAEEATGKDAVQRHIGGIEETIEETLSLSEDIRQFRQTFENKESQSKVVDLVTITREQAATLRAERPGADFDVDLSGSARVVTNDLIEQAIRNVMRNAIQHNDAETPEVAIELDRRTDEQEVELRIADNGPGLPPETVEVLQLEQESQLSHLSGFGLWLVNWVVGLSGGTLDFASNDPRGTVVKLVLPAAGPEEAIPEKTHVN